MSAMPPTEDVIRLMAWRLVIQAEEAAVTGAWYRARHLGDTDTMNTCIAESDALFHERMDANETIEAAEKAP